MAKYICSERYGNLAHSRIAQAIMRIFLTVLWYFIACRAPWKNFQVVILATT